MNATSDPLYEKYANKGLIPEEILATGIIAVICLMAICLNFSLVFVTIKTKSLHSPCKTLIALFAFFASFLLFGNCIKFFVFLFGFNYIPLKSCFLIQIVPLICSSLAINLQCGIGIDRLFGVVFPIWYKSRGKHISFKAIITFCCIRSAINGFIIYIGSSNHWEQPVMCNLGDPFHQPENAKFADISSFISYCTEFLFYLLIWLVIWKRSTQIPAQEKKLTISVSVLISIGLVCFILNMFIIQFILPLLNFDAFAFEFFVHPFSVFLQTLAYGSSAPVLYFCSSEYRSAFRSLFTHQTTVVQIVNKRRQQNNNNNNR
ncbi:hypothetical protein niasHS_005985 [Heterodera schachtii]|uniref:Uncharacterized protein n=1 Tax=Heterodera schachtii TaxID=97005 RepID=A0ABD2JN97_HETSC